jgi:hypothetical protein
MRGGNAGDLWSNRAKGFVIGFGPGATYDLNGTFFANLGVDYQLGYQSVGDPAPYRLTDHARTQFFRLAVGGGLKF